MQFTSKIYSSLKTRLKIRYEKNLNLALRSLKKSQHAMISSWVIENASDLKEYSPIKWNFLQLVNDFLFLSSHSLDLGKNFGELEEVVFEKWSKSEFADIFLKALNKRMSLRRASLHTLKVFDKHLSTYGERHILKNDAKSAAYRFQSSLGEFEKKKKVLSLLHTILHVEGKDLTLMTCSLKEMKTFSQRIEVALKIIKKFSPSSSERFNAFTEVIIPINRPELVSYSHQDLPGFSMINLYHRDFVDLMDDLLHENGHHHLNYYLNLGTLIEEPLENIYFSPWRRTLRPLRGIYHAYFTFFWAFKLFADLSNAKDVDSIYYVFKKEEKEKIFFRALEEYYMLQFTFQDLKLARKEGLIYDAGWELIQEQHDELKRFKSKVIEWERKLKVSKKQLSELKRNLRAAERDFKKS